VVPNAETTWTLLVGVPGFGGFVSAWLRTEEHQPHIG
jgi:hypothetical protein